MNKYIYQLSNFTHTSKYFHINVNRCNYQYKWSIMSIWKLARVMWIMKCISNPLIISLLHTVYLGNIVKHFNNWIWIKILCKYLIFFMFNINKKFKGIIGIYTTTRLNDQLTRDLSVLFICNACVPLTGINYIQGTLIVYNGQIPWILKNFLNYSRTCYSDQLYIKTAWPVHNGSI